MFPIRRVVSLILAAAMLWVGCVASSGPAYRVDGWPGGLSVDDPVSEEIQREILSHAAEIMTDAVEAERWITPSLRYLTEVRGGRLEGLENRLKKRDSLVRKIYTRWSEDRSVEPSDIAIDDAVRYLLVIDDTPPGHTDRSIREILTIMGGIGHSIVQIKNYWPRGDDYSGINSVLVAPNGTTWELQFHTEQSLGAKNRVHPLYEVYRLPETPIVTKRELYEEMAEIWEEIPIPEGILEPGSLHPKEEIIQHPPP